jgi:hypothetical protein
MLLKALPLLAVAFVAASPPPATSLAPGLRFLLRNSTLCDDRERLCIEASVTWEPNERLVELYGRVKATARPGVFVIVLVGHARDGTARYAEMRVPLEGRYSEIARHKMIPDWPEVQDWAIDHARFEPGRPRDPTLRSSPPQS